MVTAAAQYPGARLLLFGILFILVVIFFPKGVIGSWKIHELAGHAAYLVGGSRKRPSQSGGAL